MNIYIDGALCKCFFLPLYGISLTLCISIIYLCYYEDCVGCEMDDHVKSVSMSKRRNNFTI